MTNLNVRFFVILKKPPILFIPNNIQAKAGQKLPLKTGQKMNFPQVDKRLYYIYCIIVQMIIQFFSLCLFSFVFILVRVDSLQY